MPPNIRILSKAYLPSPIRTKLGALWGRFWQNIIRPILGFYFDFFIKKFKADGCNFIIPKVLTSRSYRAAFVVDEYEKEERSLILKHLRPTDHVLEAGACLGIVSCITNKILNRDSRHLVVEGNPYCLASLHTNKILNDCFHLIENAAICNSNSATFYLHPVYIVGGNTDRASNRAVHVPGYTLNELDERHGPFNVLILDIEGAEVEALEKSHTILSHYRLVILELHPWATGEEGAESCRKIFRKAGFTPLETIGNVEAWHRNE